MAMKAIAHCWFRSDFACASRRRVSANIRLSRTLTDVHVNDVFWAPRIETNRKVTIPFAFQKDEETGRLDNFLRAGAALRGETLTNKKPPGYPFDDTDVYKVIEGASYALTVQPDPQLEAYID